MTIPIEKKITMALAKAGALMSIRKLRNNLNLNTREGNIMFTEACKNLINSGTIDLEGTGRSGDPLTYCIQKYSDDERLV
jgi:hypothetical protein